MNKLILAAGLGLLLAGCATGPTAIGARMDWGCDGGAAFSARIMSNGAAEVFAGGQVYNLPRVEGASGVRYSNGAVEYREHGGQATLSGARGGPYHNCRR